MPQQDTSKNIADVIVIGAGNAAFCAALSAQERGAKVLMLEAAPEDESGGKQQQTGCAPSHTPARTRAGRRSRAVR